MADRTDEKGGFSVGWTRARVTWLEGVCGLFITVALVLGLAGCVAAPPGPRGPLLGPGMQAGGDLALAVSYAEARKPGGSVASGTSDHVGSPYTLVPQRAEVRVSPIDWMDLGVDLGWIGAGTDLRFGVPATEDNSLAENLAIGVRSGEPGLMKDTKSTRSLWSRFEAYPRANEVMRLVLSIGVDGGSFYHELRDPDAVPHDNEYREPAIEIVRRELRLEGRRRLLFHAPAQPTQGERLSPGRSPALRRLERRSARRGRVLELRRSRVSSVVWCRAVCTWCALRPVSLKRAESQ